MDDQWAAEQLTKHRQRIHVLEGQVAALNWILRAVVTAMPHVTSTYVREQLKEERKRIDLRLRNALDEAEKAGLEATRKLLLVGDEAAQSHVPGLKWEPPDQPSS